LSRQLQGLRHELPVGVKGDDDALLRQPGRPGAAQHLQRNRDRLAQLSAPAKQELFLDLDD